jgi:hypothetical protein
MKTNFLEEFEVKRKTLEEIKIVLKEKFVGIDTVINKVIDGISLWYLTPEFQFRPLIISLWGITGVGKTDLIRTLVKLLKFNDKFIEIQMDTKNSYSKNIEDFLESSEIDSSEPAILLLDEIQRYRTIDESGDRINNEYYNDIWMLLSDGKFQNNSERKSNLMNGLFDEIYINQFRTKKETEQNDDEKEPDKIYKTSYWSAKRFKKLLKLTLSVEEIMKLSFTERMDLMEEYSKYDNINEGNSYEKLLIFISGNLDEAFTMAENVDDTDRDADIYHELSLRINIIDIKNALASKFKPEQIARFGNNHIIYPCLNKENYNIIIRKNCQQITDTIKKEHGIEIRLSNNVYETIYRNGVFPTQGVRPVISTVNNLFGSNLPYFLHNSLLNNSNELSLDIENNYMVGVINGVKYNKELALDIDIIRKNKNIDEKTLIMVHELGHALVYALLYKTPPKQINVNATGFSSGFIINHSSIDNKTFIKNRIAIYLSGIVAEEIVFGEDYKSTGSSADIIYATDIAGKYVRVYAMDGTISRIGAVSNIYETNTDIIKTNDIIENILIEEKKRARDLINGNIHIYKKLLRFTQKNNGINTEQFLKICNDNNMNLKEIDLNDKLMYSYDDKINKFLEQ